MYLFGIVVTASDNTPMGHASSALRVRLPALFPEHAFQLLEPAEVPELRPEHVARLLFVVLSSEVRNEADDEVLADTAPHALVQTVQDAVDEIVADARSRHLH